MRPAVFFDRDDTIIPCGTEGMYYVVDPFQVNVYGKAVAALDEAALAGYHLVCVSNQSCVERRVADWSKVLAVTYEIAEQWSRRLLAAARLSHIMTTLNGDAYIRVILRGFPYDLHFLYCGHAKDCPWRKPSVGAFYYAASVLHIDLHDSVVVGDGPTDRAAAENLGIPFFDATARDCWERLLQHVYRE